MKLCKDCTHFIETELSCARSKYVEPVLGMTRVNLCSDERDDLMGGESGGCGFEAEHFKPKSKVKASASRKAAPAPKLLRIPKSNGRTDGSSR